MSRAKSAEMARTHTDETQAPGAMAAPFEITTLAQAKRAAWVGAFRGLAMQGWRKAIEGAVCAWRTPCDDAPGGVLRCAVGWLISDERLAFNSRVSGGAGYVWSDPTYIAVPLRPWAKSEAFSDFLLEMQRAHDHAATPKEMRENFEALAAKYDLGPLPTLPAGCA